MAVLFISFVYLCKRVLAAIANGVTGIVLKLPTMSDNHPTRKLFTNAPRAYLYPIGFRDNPHNCDISTTKGIRTTVQPSSFLKGRSKRTLGTMLLSLLPRGEVNKR